MKKFFNFRFSILVAALLLFAACSSGEMKASLEVDEQTGDITIEVSGLSGSDADDYLVAVIHGTTIENTIAIGSDGKALYSAQQMFEGECYTFNIVNADDQHIVKEVQWTNDNNYCKPIPTAEDSTPEPDFQCDPEPNPDTKTYTVTINVHNLGNLSNVSYSVNGTSQSDPVFHNVPSGDCEVVVSSGSRSKSATLFLPEIKGPQMQLTKDDLQKILDQVAKGKLTAGQAKEKVMPIGDIPLKKPVKGHSSLLDILDELTTASIFGEPNPYIVVDFKTDPKTHRILPNTLELKTK